MTDQVDEPQASPQMEGTWGRRIWGKISKGRGITRFYLVMTVRDGFEISQDRLVSHEDLEYAPVLYATTLNRMVKEIQDELDSLPDSVTPLLEPEIPELVTAPMPTRVIEQPEPYVLPTDPTQ